VIQRDTIQTAKLVASIDRCRHHPRYLDRLRSERGRAARSEEAPRWSAVHQRELLEISFVSVPADTGAGVTARHAPRTDAQIAMLAALPATPRAALQRAAASFSSKRSNGRLVSPTLQTWALLKASEERQGHDHAAR
jgi:hypothetical protein